MSAVIFSGSKIVGSGGSVYLQGAGGGGASPTQVQLLITALQFASTNFTLPAQASWQLLGWESVAGASSYNIYRQEYNSDYSIASAYSFLINVSASAAATAYSSYVSSNTGGGFGAVSAVDSAYQDQTASVVVNLTKGAGPTYYNCNGYSYKVSAIVGGVESAQSTDSYIPFFADGVQVMCFGVFNGNITSWADTTAPFSSPLGFTKNVLWTAVNPGDLINPFSGIGCYGQQLGIVGMNYMVVNALVDTAGTNFVLGPELRGDYSLLTSNPNSTAYGTLTPSHWVSLKVPISSFYIDQAGGTNAIQDAFYKVTLVANQGSKIWLEWYFSRN